MAPNKHQKRPRDMNQHAASTVSLATGESEVVETMPEVTQASESTKEERHAAALTLGRKGGQSRAKNLTPEQRTEIAKKAAKERWRKE